MSPPQRGCRRRRDRRQPCPDAAGAVVAAIPSPVIGGASLAMFASVAIVGIQTQSVFLAQGNLSGDVDVVFPSGKKNRLKMAINSRFEPLIRKLFHAETKHPWSMGYAPFDVISPFLSDSSFDVIQLHWVNGGFFDIATIVRSEERRVGKECRSRWSPYH